MTKTFLALAVLSLVPLAVGAAGAGRPQPRKPPARASRGQRSDAGGSAALHAVFDEQWEYWMKDDPTWASTLGDRRYDDRWPDRSLESFAARDRQDRAILEKVHRIDRAALPVEDQLDYDLFERRISEDLEERRFRRYLVPLDHISGIQTQNELVEELRLETVADYENWIARLRGIDTLVDQTMGLMREGVRTGLVPPRVIMERVPARIAAQVVDDPESSPFYKAFRTMPDAIPAAEQQRLRKDGARAIREVVVPAYRRFQAYFRDEYLPKTRDSVGASDLPDGEAYYAFQVRRHTTTDLTPAAIHAKGMAEVARIHAAMEDIIRKVGFQGDFPAFLAFLRTDPRFYAKSPEELLAVYRAAAKQVDPELVRLFGRLPRMPYGVKPVPEENAANQTTAYYDGPAADGTRAGIYRVNLYKPETRPLWEVEALTLHESVPGHHLQIALAMELGDLPKFRRYTGYTAYVEGWGLYAESLGDEMGLYSDPYSKFGQLTYEMWRAVRLVVDTGIHEMGWSRQQAIDYFKANAAKTEHDITNEVDRYIAWPGQALAYKVGELKIKALRQRAQEQLGDRFDVRGFHDTVLGSGAVPLDVLERNVDAWIAQRAKAPPPR